MGSFAFFLRFEKPEVDLTRAEQNVVRFPFKEEGSQDVIWTVANFVHNRLDRLVGFDVPNLYHLVGSQ